MHQGKLLEQAIVSQLVAANTVAADRVYRERVDPFKKGALPAITLRITDEEVDRDASADTAPRELTRIADVEIQLLVKGSDEAAISDAMWDFQEQTENAMHADFYFGGAAGDSILKRVNRDIGEVDGKSDPLIGVTTLVFSVTYRTYPGAVDATDDFITVDAKHQIVGGVTDTVPAEDLFTVQEPP